MSKEKKVSSRISEQLFNALEQRRESEYLNVSALIRQLLVNYLKLQELNKV